MNKSTKEKYREFCQKEKNIPIFSKDWWLDSVCGKDDWGVVMIEKGGSVVASMPYYMIRNKRFKFLAMPKLTQNLGPYIVYPKNQSYYKKLSFEKDIMFEIENKLPKVDSFSQNFHYNVTNWLPFFWRGYSQTTFYTYTIDNLQSLDDVSSKVTSSYRNKIKKAEKIVEISKGLAIEDFYDINRKTFERQNIETPYDLSFIKKHDEYLAKKNSREIFYALDADKRIHSALYLTWDANSAYVHMVGEDPEFRNSGAGILLIKEAVLYSKDTLKVDTFDFEGSMIEGVEQVRRSFGAKQKPYSQITKVNSKFLDVIKSIKRILK